MASISSGEIASDSRKSWWASGASANPAHRLLERESLQVDPGDAQVPPVVEGRGGQGAGFEAGEKVGVGKGVGVHRALLGKRRAEARAVGDRQVKPLALAAVECPEPERAISRALGWASAERLMGGGSGRIGRARPPAPEGLGAMGRAAERYMPMNSMPLRRMSAPKATRMSPEAHRTAAGRAATARTRWRKACEP
jgi:hypothetical protein